MCDDTGGPKQVINKQNIHAPTMDTKKNTLFSIFMYTKYKNFRFFFFVWMTVTACETIHFTALYRRYFKLAAYESLVYSEHVFKNMQ